MQAPSSNPLKNPYYKVNYKQSGVRTVRMIGYAIIAINILAIIVIMKIDPSYALLSAFMSLPIILAAAGMCFAAATIAEAALFVKAKIERDNRIISN